jgi:hypothetical protein
MINDRAPKASQADAHELACHVASWGVLEKRTLDSLPVLGSGGGR